MNNKLTFVELVDMVAQAANTSKRMSELFLKELVATISQALIDGEQVTVKGIGTFALERRGDEAQPRVNFTPDNALAEAINQPFAQFETITLDDTVTDAMLDAVDNEEPIDEPQPEVAPEEPEATEPTPPPFAAPVEEPQPVEDEPQTEEDPEPTEEPATVEEETQPAEPDEEPDEIEDKPHHRHHEVTVAAAMAHEQHHADVRRSFIHGMVVGALAAFLVSALVALGFLLSTQRVTLSPRIGETAQQADTIADDQPHAAAPADTAKQQAKPAQAVQDAKPATTAKVVTDTISHTMFLSRMAQKHYGKSDFWVYIYEENKALIDDPNAVPPGTVVVIPPAAKYGIDPADKASVDRARRRAYEVLSGH